MAWLNFSVMTIWSAMTPAGGMLRTSRARPVRLAGRDRLAPRSPLRLNNRPCANAPPTAGSCRRTDLVGAGALRRLHKSYDA